MNRLAKCPVYGKEFTADRLTQTYCSAACRHRDEAPPAQRACGKTVRSFRCLRWTADVLYSLSLRQYGENLCLRIRKEWFILRALWY